MKRKKLMLSYGSNMSVEQMEYRCPEARIVGIAEIQDYRLMYKGSQTGAYATIEPEKGMKVPVLVWEITPRDEASLDRYEGYPNFYYKKELEVEINLISSETPPPSYGKHKAMVYIMDERRVHGLPSPRYENILREGYKDFGFDKEVLDEAFAYTVQQVYGKQMAN